MYQKDLSDTPIDGLWNKGVGNTTYPTHVEHHKQPQNQNHKRIVDSTKNWYDLPRRNSNSGAPKTEGKVHGSDSPKIDDKHAHKKNPDQEGKLIKPVSQKMQSQP